MSFEHFERGYLLPSGCKDLIDAMKFPATPQAKIWFKSGSAPVHQVAAVKAELLAKIFLKHASAQGKAPPAVKGDLLVPEHATAKELADLLGQKPFKIIADAIGLGIFASVNQSLDFEMISAIARLYGYIAKKT